MWMLIMVLSGYNHGMDSVVIENIKTQKLCEMIIEEFKEDYKKTRISVKGMCIKVD